MDAAGSVHLFSADTRVQAHWRHGLAGRARLFAHERWPAADTAAGVALVDLHLPGLPPLALLEDWAPPPALRLVACSHLPHDDEGLAALRAGFRGYCNVWSSTELLPRLVQAVAIGELWVGRSLLTRLVQAVAVRPGAPVAAGWSGNWREPLTEREQEVACLVADGASNKEVARRLGVTERTVKDHLTHIFSKLNLHDRVQLALHVHGVALS